MPIELNMGKNSSTGIGQKRVRDPLGFGPREKPMRQVSKGQAAENRVLKVMKELIRQEYREAGELAEKQFYELDHIHGRSKEGFVLTAMFDPKNFQLLTKAQHREKTNPSANSVVTTRFDYRSKAIQARMTDLSDRLVKKLGPVWNLLDLKRVIESEIYLE